MSGLSLHPRTSLSCLRLMTLCLSKSPPSVFLSYLSPTSLSNPLQHSSSTQSKSTAQRLQTVRRIVPLLLRSQHPLLLRLPLCLHRTVLARVHATRLRGCTTWRSSPAQVARLHSKQKLFNSAQSSRPQLKLSRPTLSLLVCERLLVGLKLGIGSPQQQRRWKA